ncbi:MAG: hypothetical protein K9M51_00295 [Candidatus Gracilibacteria bacterium]|nr:hypothetical protein [Candidatus Gracilibacteria bacterium]
MKFLTHSAPGVDKNTARFIWQQNPESHDWETESIDEKKEWAQENLETDTRERLEALKYQAHKMHAAEVANASVDQKLPELMDKLQALSSPADEATLRALAAEYLINKTLADPEEQKMYRTEMFATFLRKTNGGKSLSNLTPAEVSVFLRDGMAAVYSFAPGSQSVHNSLYAASRMMKYDLDSAGVNVREWTTEAGKSIMRYEAQMNASTQTGSVDATGNLLVAGTVLGKIRGCEILTGAAMAEYPADLLTAFEFSNVVIEDNRILARVSNGCHGNLAAIKLESVSVIPVPDPEPEIVIPEVEPECPLDDECMALKALGVGTLEEKQATVKKMREELLGNDDELGKLGLTREALELVYKPSKRGTKSLEESLENFIGGRTFEGGVIGWIEAAGKAIFGSKKDLEKMGLSMDAFETMKKKGTLYDRAYKNIEKMHGRGHFDQPLKLLGQDLFVSLFTSVVTMTPDVVLTNIKTPFFKKLHQLGDMDTLVAQLAAGNETYTKRFLDMVNAMDQLEESELNLMRDPEALSETADSEYTTEKNTALNDLADDMATTVERLEDHIDLYTEGARKEKHEGTRRSHRKALITEKSRDIKRASYRGLSELFEKKFDMRHALRTLKTDLPDRKKVEALETIIREAVAEFNEDAPSGSDKLKFEGLGKRMTGFDRISLGKIKTRVREDGERKVYEQEIFAKMTANGQWEFWISNEDIIRQSKTPGASMAKYEKLESDGKSWNKLDRKLQDRLTMLSAIKELHGLATDLDEVAQHKDNMQQRQNIAQQAPDESAEENVYESAVYGFLGSFQNYDAFEKSGMLKFFPKTGSEEIKKFYDAHRTEVALEALTENEQFQEELKTMADVLKSDVPDLLESALASDEIMEKLMDPNCHCEGEIFRYVDVTGRENHRIPISLGMIRSLFKMKEVPFQRVEDNAQWHLEFEAREALKGPRLAELVMEGYSQQEAQRIIAQEITNQLLTEGFTQTITRAGTKKVAASVATKLELSGKSQAATILAGVIANMFSNKKHE